SALRSMLSGGSDQGGPALRSGWRKLLIGAGKILLQRPLTLNYRKRLTALGIPIIFGKRVAVIGGDMTACQLADLLAAHGRQVTLVAKNKILCEDMVSTLKNRLLNRLASRGVTILPGVKSYEKISASELTIVTGDGRTQSIGIDTVIAMTGFEGNRASARAYKDVTGSVHVIGDCDDPLKLLHAVHDGARLGREL
ncbi:MAG: FAD-dependent oxidoreductase, partial [Desulfuromonadaceae bacterium]